MKGKYTTWLVVVFLIFSFLYLYNIAGWQMHDDEGTDLYEVWQFQRGAVPGVDFIAAQQPLFLVTGGALVDWFGQEMLPPRLLAAVQVLLGALVLMVAVRRIWGDVVAMLAFGFVLVSGLIYEQARLFRPDPMMFAWEVIGLSMAMLATVERKRRYWALAGVSYGISMMWKPLGFFPVVGLVIYFVEYLWRERQSWRAVFIDGLYFAIPFLLVGLGVSALFYSSLGFYYLEPLSQHQQLGQGTPFWQQIRKVVNNYLLFALFFNAVWLLIIPLWFLNKSGLFFRRSAPLRLLSWQFLAPVVLVAMTRPMFPRYFIFLVPVFAIIMAVQLELAFSRIGAQNPQFIRSVPWVVLGVLAFAAAVSQPSLPSLLLRKEADTRALSELVAEQTAPTDVVLSDYATINFLAERDSIYEASIIAGGKVSGGIITGELLIERIEEDDVSTVLIHVAGGEPIPHQIIEMIDYPAFRTYLQTNFELQTVYDRAGQQIEVYQRQ